jgi:hypothetical protein
LWAQIAPQGAERTAYEQLADRAPDSKQCRSCCYWAGKYEPVRCAVNPYGDAEQCSHWEPR